MNEPKPNNNWWKGNFPLWIVVILLSLLGWFIQREVRNVDAKFSDIGKDIVDLKLQVTELRIRTALMEQQLQDGRLILERIELQIKPLWRP